MSGVKVHNICPFGRFWRVIPSDHELSAHESERLKCSILPTLASLVYHTRGLAERLL